MGNIAKKNSVAWTVTSPRRVLSAMTDTTGAADFEVRCRQAIAPIIGDFLTKKFNERDDMALTNRILTALGEQHALTESAYEYRDAVRACIIASLGRDHCEPPEVAIIAAMSAKGFLGRERRDA